MSCANSNCVQVRKVGQFVEVTDDHGNVECWSPAAWNVFIDGIKQGADLGWVKSPFGDLVFTDTELTAFVAGVRRGEFDVERLSAEWKSARPAEGDGDAFASEATPEASTALSGRMSAVSGAVASEVHPAVVDDPDVEPGWCDSCGCCWYHSGCADQDNPLQPGDCADCGACAECISECRTHALADEIEAGTPADHTTKEQR